MHTNNCSEAVITFLNWLVQPERAKNDLHYLGQYHLIKVVKIAQNWDETMTYTVWVANTTFEEFAPLEFEIAVNLEVDRTIHEYTVANRHRCDLGEILEFMGRNIKFVIDPSKHHYFLKTTNSYLRKAQIKKIITTMLTGSFQDNQGKCDMFNVVIFDDRRVTDIIDVVMVYTGRRNENVGSIIVTPQRSNWPWAAGFIMNPATSKVTLL